MPIKKGNTVSVHYIGTFNDGTEFDRSQQDSPLTFTVGSGQVIQGFDQAVIGHEVGDSFTVSIPAAQAYGEREERKMFQVSMKSVPQNIKPEVGMHLHVATNQGELEVSVAEVHEEYIVLDANHPMAGKDLNFSLKIEKIN